MDVIQMLLFCLPSKPCMYLLFVTVSYMKLWTSPYSSLYSHAIPSLSSVECPILVFTSIPQLPLPAYIFPLPRLKCNCLKKVYL